MEGNFGCDRKSKELFAELMNSLFYRTVLDIPEYEKSHIDIYMTGQTSNGKSRAYAVELKERWNYSSTDYGWDGQEGWMLESQKLTYLEEAKNSGYTPLYVCLFKDGVMGVWNLDDMPEGWKNDRCPDKLYPRHTVISDGVIRKSAIELYNRDAKLYKSYDEIRNSRRDSKERYS